MASSNFVTVRVFYPLLLHVTVQFSIYLQVACLTYLPGARGWVIVSSPPMRCTFRSPGACRPYIYGLAQDCLITESSPELTRLSGKDCLPLFWSSSNPLMLTATAAWRIGYSAALKTCEGEIFNDWYPLYHWHLCYYTTYIFSCVG